MALIPVIEGAGGVITDKYNQKINLDSRVAVLLLLQILILHNDSF